MTVNKLCDIIQTLKISFSEWLTRDMRDKFQCCYAYSCIVQTDEKMTADIHHIRFIVLKRLHVPNYFTASVVLLFQFSHN